jgi:hypothetical protein
MIVAMPDAPARPAAPLDESAYTVSIDEAADRYSAAGLPRPIRRLQKYCARGDLECRKVETTSGEKYLITPESIERHIAYIEETSGRPPCTDHVKPKAVKPKPSAANKAFNDHAARANAPGAVAKAGQLVGAGVKLN